MDITCSNSTNQTGGGGGETKNTFNWKDNILLSFLVLVFIIGVCGNALVCYYFKLKGYRKLAGMEILIFYLAFSDLIASIINPLLYIYWQVTFTASWHFGEIGCKIIPASAKISTFMSFGIILVITIDRCIVICSPFNLQIKKNDIRVLIFIVFVMSVLCEIPDIYYHEVDEGKYCYVKNSEEPGFFYPTLTLIVLRDILFLVIFFVSIFLIYKELYNEETRSTLKKQKDLKKTKKIIRILITLALVFIFLVYPRDILHIAYMVAPILAPPGIPYTKYIIDINTALKLLHMCNSVCNVFIYAGLHTHFRKKLLYLIKYILCSSRKLRRRKTITFTYEEDFVTRADLMSHNCDEFPHDFVQYSPETFRHLRYTGNRIGMDKDGPETYI